MHPISVDALLCRFHAESPVYYVMTSFCKKKECPASRDLLDVSTGEVTPSQFQEVEDHFCECEFCRAELEFYRHYPQATEAPKFQKIPAPLFDLATSLLGRDRELTRFYQLMTGGSHDPQI